MPEALNIPHETLSKIAETYCAAEASLKDLAQKFGVNYNTLKGLSSRLGWPAKRAESLAKAVNPDSVGKVRSDAERLFHHQVRFQQEVPDELRRTRLRALTLARKAEKDGNFKDAGALLQVHVQICRHSKNIIGIDLAEELQRDKSRSEKNQPPICNPVPPSPTGAKTIQPSVPIEPAIEDSADGPESQNKDDVNWLGD